MNLIRCLKVGIFFLGLILIAGCSTDDASSCSGNGPCPDGYLAVQPPVYCYKTIGTVDCYSERNPYDTERSPRVKPVQELESPDPDGQVLCTPVCPQYPS
ncbi:hypothetical protein [Sneathiella sp.]|uniref:hypothetical protein n=1 Tax=Sneathiella sp. TaxID=1964365 RepID=UPI0035639469